MGYIPTPTNWVLRIVKGSTLTHVELDENQKSLNTKINDTVGQNLGSGSGIYSNKVANPDDGFLQFRSLVAGPGVTVNTLGNEIFISSSGGTAGSGSTDYYVSDVTYSADTICISLNDGTQWCVNMSGSTPYEYGEGTYSIQPKLDNSYSKSDFSNIGGGRANLITSASTDSNISGGRSQTIESWGSFIGGGSYNRIHPDSIISSIVGGSYNEILSGSPKSVIVNGSVNIINSGLASTAIIGGSGLIGSRSNTTFMEGLDVETNVQVTNRPFKYHGTFANENNNYILTSDALGNAQWKPGPGLPNTPSGCTITGTTTVGCITTFHTDCSGTTLTADTCDGSYSPYRPTGGVNSITTTLAPPLGIGENSVDVTSDYSTISAGMSNKISDESSWSNVVGGISNYIDQSRLSAIVAGRDNKISVPGGLTAGHGVILNGAYNRVSHSHSVIMGAENITTDRINTVFMNGLDVFTNASTVYGGASQQPFKYHGILANDGTTGYVLKTFDNLGNAHWQPGPGLPITPTGCTITGTTTVGCITTFHTDCSGTTLTADTCDGSYSPYRPTGGVNSITTTLAGPLGIGENVVDITSGYSTISAGMGNKISNLSSWSNVVGGITNYIEQSRLSAIVTGRDNLISIPGGVTAGHGVILNGAYNIVKHSHSVIMGAENITTNRQNTVFMNGLDVFTNASTVFGGASQQPFRYHGVTANENLGYVLTSDALGNSSWQPGPGLPIGPSGCTITGTTTVGCITTFHTDCSGTTLTADTCDGSYSPYRPTGGVNSITTTLAGPLGIGENVVDVTSGYSTISAGMSNKISNLSSWSNVVGGISNYIDQSRLSAIVTGRDNLISVPGGVTAGHGAILNGAYNIVNHSHSVIMGAENITTDRQNTVFMNGLDVFTNASTVFGGASQQPFRYHGTVANSGTAGFVLTSINAAGDAHWQPGAVIPQNDPNCPIVSAITVNTGCTLVLINCTGGTISADTCNTFGGISPYEFRANMSISTVLPGGTVADNHISNNQTYSNIQGGHYNKINTYGPGQNAIGGGLGNVIGGKNVKVVLGNTAWSNIGGGYENQLVGSDHYYMNISGGRKNQILDGSWSHIGGGNENIITASTRTFIGGGDRNFIRSGSNYSSIVGGTGNDMSSASYSAILNGLDNISTHDYSVVMGGANITTDNTYTVFMNGLNVQSNSSGGNRYFRYHGGASNSGNVGDVLTAVDTSGNAVWTTPCCSGGTGTGGSSGATKYVSTDNYVSNVELVHTHGLDPDGVIINVWNESGYRIDGEIREINSSQIGVTLSESQSSVKVVIIG